MPDIQLSLDALRRRRSGKWSDYPGDVIPAWLAEMDFALADPVLESLQELVRRQDGGYPRRGGGAPGMALAQAFSERMRERFGWIADPAHVQPLSDLKQGIAACIAAFTEPGDAVITHTPCYPALRLPVIEMGRRFVAHPLVDDGTRFQLDRHLLESAPPPRTRMLLLCNPHNPTGRMFDRGELRLLSAYALKHGLVVVADEVHADLSYGLDPHVPFASLDAQTSAITVTLNSASKSFNIAGLRCALMHFGSGELAQRFRRKVPELLLGQPGIAGVDATLAAWRDGQPWLDAVLAQLRANRAWLAQSLGRLEGVRFHSPEATYFSWLDCTALGLKDDAAAFFLRQARVALSAGQSFAPESSAFVRMNFATSPSLLEEIVNRLHAALLPSPHSFPPRT